MGKPHTCQSCGRESVTSICLPCAEAFNDAHTREPGRVDLNRIEADDIDDAILDAAAEGFPDL